MCMCGRDMQILYLQAFSLAGERALRRHLGEYKRGTICCRGGPWVVNMDGPGGTVCSNIDGLAGPVIVRTIYGVTEHVHK